MPHFARITPTNLNPQSAATGGPTTATPTVNVPVVVADDESNILSLASKATATGGEAAGTGGEGAPLTKSKSSFSMAKERKLSQRAAPSSTLVPKEPPRLRCKGVFPVSVDDKATITSMARELIPLISARDNVTVLLSGHEKTGKTCLLEQLLIQVIDGLKIALTSAEEAHQENLSIGLETTAPYPDGSHQPHQVGGRDLLRAQTPGGDRITAQADAALGAMKRGDNADGSGGDVGSPAGGSTGLHIAGAGSPAIRQKRAQTASMRRRSLGGLGGPASRSPQRGQSAGGWRSSPARPGTAGPRSSSTQGFFEGEEQPNEKYALLFSRLGPGAKSLSMSEVGGLRPRSAQPLLPKIDPLTLNGAGGLYGLPGLAGSAGSPEKKKREGEVAYMAQVHMRSKSPVRMFTGLMTRVKNNGRAGGDHSTLAFDGEKTCYILPHIPAADLALKSKDGLRISFWICTDEDPANHRRKMGLFHFTDELDANFTLRMVLNCNEAEQYEYGQSLMTVRDSHGKTLEIQFQDGICDGKWHKVQVDFAATQNTIALSVDGKKCRFSIKRTETPATVWEERPKIGRVGCYMTASTEGKLTNNHHFHGFMCDLQFSSAGPAIVSNDQVFAHYPLVNTQDGKELAERKERFDPMIVEDGGIPMDNGSMTIHHTEGTLAASATMMGSSDGTAAGGDSFFRQQPLFETFPFPATSVNFDGKSTFMNLGTLGDFGIHMNTFSLECHIRTSCTTAPMTVIGITDEVGKSSTKHPGFSVDLNVNHTGATTRHCMCITVTDYAGKYLCCTSSDCNELFDDRWHHMSVKLVDPVLGRFKVKVDGKPIDLTNHHSHPLPSDFATFNQYVTIGCLNNRGRSLANFFKGSIHHFSLSRTCDDLDEVIASWPMEEGPGATLAMDTTGHGFNGVYSIATSGNNTTGSEKDKASTKNCSSVKGSVWFPLGEGGGAAQAQEGDALASALGAEGLNVVRHNNNVVTMAFLGLHPRVTVNGNVEDQLVDFIHGNTYKDLVPRSLRSTSNRAPSCDERQFKWIPQQCFKVVTPSDYQRVFGAALAKSQDFGNRAHIVFILRLGDAIFSVFDLASYSKSKKATFNSTQLSWSDSISTFGVANKLNRALNHDLSLLDKFLVRCGTTPQMFKRSRMLLQTTGLSSDSFLVSLVMFCMLSGKEFSRLFNVMMYTPYSYRMEGIHLMSVAHAMDKSNMEHAAIVVQKHIRYRRGRRIYFKKLQTFDEAASRRDHAALTRRNYPNESKTKTLKQALLFFCLNFEQDTRLAPVPYGFDDLSSTARLLDSLGYKVAIHVNSSKEEIKKLILREQASADKQQLLVYFVGYGLFETPYAVPPSFETIRKWSEKQEEDTRVSLLQLEHRDFSSLMSQAELGKAAVEEEIRRREAEAAAKASKKGRKGRGGASAAPTAPKKKPVPAKEDKKKPGGKAGKSGKGGKEVAAAPEDSTAAAGGEAEESKIDAAAIDSDINGEIEEEEQEKDNRSIVEPLFDHEPKSFFFCGDSTSLYNAENTLLISELRTLVLGEKPKKGHHAMLIYDCLTPKVGDVGAEETSITASSSPHEGTSSSNVSPVVALGRPLSPSSDTNENTVLSATVTSLSGGGATTTAGGASGVGVGRPAAHTLRSPGTKSRGFGGIIGSSSEEVFVDYTPTQKFLFGFYLKRLLTGCGVEAVRIGKHDPPAETTLETAFTYLQRKLDPRCGSESGGPAKFPVLRYNSHWYGEYVGDAFLCEKTLLSRADRKKNKTVNASKKHNTKIDCSHLGAWTPDLRTALLQKLTETSRAALLDAKRLVVQPHITLYLQADWHVASFHPQARAEIVRFLNAWFPTFDDSPHLSEGEAANSPIDPDTGLKKQPTWKLTINPLALHVSPCINAPCFAQPVSLEDDRGHYDIKGKSREYFTQTELQTQMVEKCVIDPCNKINLVLEKFNRVASLKEDERVQAERDEAAAKSGEGGGSKPVFLISSEFSMDTSAVLTPGGSEDSSNIALHPSISKTLVSLPLTPPTASSGNRQQQSLIGLRYTEIDIALNAMTNEDEGMKLERGARTGTVSVTHVPASDSEGTSGSATTPTAASSKKKKPSETTAAQQAQGSVSSYINSDEETLLKTKWNLHTRGHLIPCVTTLIGTKACTEKEATRFTAEEQMISHEEQRKLADQKAALFKEAELRRKREEEKAKLEAAKVPKIERIEEIRVVSNVTEGMIKECFDLPHIDCYFSALETMLSLANRGLVAQLDKGGCLAIVDKTILTPPESLEMLKKSERLHSAVWKLFTAFASEKDNFLVRKSVQKLIPKMLLLSMEHHAKGNLLWVGIRGTLHMFALPGAQQTSLSTNMSTVAGGQFANSITHAPLPNFEGHFIPAWLGMPSQMDDDRLDLLEVLLLDSDFFPAAVQVMHEETILSLIDHCYSPRALMRIAASAAGISSSSSSSSGGGTLPVSTVKICYERAIALFYTFGNAINSLGGATTRSAAGSSILEKFVDEVSSVPVSAVELAARLWVKEFENESSKIEGDYWTAFLHHFVKNCDAFYFSGVYNMKTDDGVMNIVKSFELFSDQVLVQSGVISRLKPVPARRLVEVLKNGILEPMMNTLQGRRPPLLGGDSGAAGADGGDGADGAPSEPLPSAIVQAFKASILQKVEEKC